MRRAFRFLTGALGGLIGLIAIAWAAGALYYDLPIPWLRTPLALVYGLVTIAALFFVKPRWRAVGLVAGGFALVLAWWFTIKPSNEGNWQPDVAQLGWAEVNGDEVILHNVRNNDYRTETDYTARWETRTVRISQVTGVDLAINYWGSPWMAHPIASFQFADAPPVCFSIETRKQVGQSYSAIGGLYRQFALIYVVADERDVIRLRTNYRHGEDVYLYRTTMNPSQARERFNEYVRSLNEIREHPRWYNAITTNCTTSIRDQHPTAERIPWDWRLLLNGKADELMFERHTIVTANLPFAELKARSLINTRAKAADALSNFSELIRVGLPEFQKPMIK
jgi:predicted transposase YbfD/YdcC